MRHAFTLIELLLVLSIIMFLSMLALPHFTTGQHASIVQELEKLEVVLLYLT